MFVKNVIFYVKPENINDFIKATLENQKNSRQEKDIECFDFFQCKDEPTKFFLYEVYKTEAGIEDHLKTEHFKKWFATVQPYYSRPREGAVYIPVTSAEE